MKEKKCSDALEQIYDNLEALHLSQATSQMESLATNLFRREKLSFQSLQKLHSLKKSISEIERSKDRYMKYRSVYGTNMDQLLVKDIGIFFTFTILEDPMILHQIGRVDFERLKSFLDSLFWEDEDYSYQKEVVTLSDAVTVTGRTLFLKKDKESKALTLYLQPHNQLSHGTDQACIIERGLVENTLFSNGLFVCAKLSEEKNAYIKYRVFSEKKETIHDRELLCLYGDSLFAYDNEGTLLVTRKGIERAVPGITKDATFDIISDTTIFCHRKSRKEGFDLPHILQLDWKSERVLTVNTSPIGARSLAFFAWKRLVKRITEADSEDTLFTTLGVFATPLNYPADFTIESVKTALEQMLSLWPTGTNCELDNLLEFIYALEQQENEEKNTLLASYLYTYDNYLTDMQDSTWSRKRVYSNATKPRSNNEDYRLTLSYHINRTPRKQPLETYCNTNK